MKLALGVDHGLRRQAIMQSLITDIIQGEYRAGHRLVTQDLASRFGVSHTPIREALIGLSGLGVLDWSPNRGAAVRRMSQREIREFCNVRRALECEAVRSACGRCNPAELDEIRHELEALLNAPEGSVPQAQELDSRLHDMIARSSGNSFLLGELNRLKILFRAMRDAAWEHDEAAKQYGRISTECEEHLKIVSALQRNDRAGAFQAMARHIRSGLITWIQALPRNGNQNSSRETTINNTENRVFPQKEKGSSKRAPRSIRGTVNNNRRKGG